MTHPSKTKGNSYERELVHQAEAAGLSAKRAYASNGEALGHHAEVDLLIDGRKIQAKRRRALAGYLIPSDHVDAVIARGDRAGSVVVMRLEDWIALISPPTASPRASVAPRGSIVEDLDGGSLGSR